MMSENFVSNKLILVKMEKKELPLKNGVLMH